VEVEFEIDVTKGRTQRRGGGGRGQLPPKENYIYNFYNVIIYFFFGYLGLFSSFKPYCPLVIRL
jgi:hypothetical protein